MTTLSESLRTELLDLERYPGAWVERDPSTALERLVAEGLVERLRMPPRPRSYAHHARRRPDRDRYRVTAAGRSRLLEERAPAHDVEDW